MAADLSSLDIIGKYYAAMEAAAGKTWVDQVSFLNADSNKDSELYNWLDAVPGMREWLGGRQAKGLSKEGIRIFNTTYEATMKIPTDWIRRDKTGLIEAKIGEMADKGATHYASLLSTLILAGQTTDCYDGKKFYAADHPAPKGGSVQKNLLTATEVPALACTAAGKPTSAEAANAILGVIGYMQSIRDSQNDPMNEFARGFLVMCSARVFGYLAPGIMADYVGGGNSNVLNKLVSAEGYNIGIQINTRLTSTTEFEIFRTDGRVGALIRQEEEGVQADVLGEGSEYELLNNAQLFMIKAIHGVGPGQWELAAHCTLS